MGFMIWNQTRASDISDARFCFSGAGKLIVNDKGFLSFSQAFYHNGVDRGKVPFFMRREVL